MITEIARREGGRERGREGGRERERVWFLKFFLADLKQRIVLSQLFGVVRLYRTFSIYIVTGETRCAGCYALVRGGSSTVHLLEPSRTTSALR